MGPGGGAGASAPGSPAGAACRAPTPSAPAGSQMNQKRSVWDSSLASPAGTPGAGARAAYPAPHSQQGSPLPEESGISSQAEASSSPRSQPTSFKTDLLTAPSSSWGTGNSGGSALPSAWQELEVDPARQGRPCSPRKLCRAPRRHGPARRQGGRERLRGGQSPVHAHGRPGGALVLWPGRWGSGAHSLRRSWPDTTQAAGWGPAPMRAHAARLHGNCRSAPLPACVMVFSSPCRWRR